MVVFDLEKHRSLVRATSCRCREFERNGGHWVERARSRFQQKAFVTTRTFRVTYQTATSVIFRLTVYFTVKKKEVKNERYRETR